MTANLNITDPAVGGSSDTWGDLLNAALDSIETWGGANGTWTPTDGSGAGLVFSSANAGYMQIGKMCLVWAVIVFPVTANGANVKIAGLPFTAQNASGGGFRFQLPGTGGGTDYGRVIVNTTTFDCYTNASVQRINSDYSLATLAFQFWYPTT